jgi:hypothetical protein
MTWGVWRSASGFGAQIGGVINVPADVGGAWTPLDLGAKLLAFYDPADQTSVFSDNGTTQVVDEDPIYRINDLSGNGYHLVQTTLGLRPGWDSDAFGSGKPGMVAPEGCVLPCSDIAHGGGNELVIGTVAIVTTLNDGRLVTWMDPGATNDFDNTPSAIALIARTSGSVAAAYRSPGYLSTAGISLSTRFRAISTFDGTNHTMTVDGSDGTPVANNNNFASPGTLYYGSGFVAGVADSAFFGTYGPLVVCNDTLTGGEKSDLDAWLAAWGV